ncbi:MAG: AAA family ATPase [Burkholderiales bacterium]|nr:AAA family ATPase [Burkholderiales bacterium]
MYLDHYGLADPPFRITPHTEFFYDGANRGATLEALIYAIQHGEGLVKVVGEVGAGKTMLCRVLMEKLPAHVDIVYLANPSMSKEEILLTIAADLKISLEGDRPPALIRALQNALIERFAAGRQVVLLIDEAHAMPAESLEEVRLLSNLEHGHDKLLQIVLFGQPELDEKLALQSMRQLRERITHGFELAPLRQTDVGEYLMFRLRTAGYKGPDLFTAKAVQMIATESEGLTRRINILADKALIASFANGRHQVDKAEAQAAIKDSAFRQMPSRQRTSRAIAGGMLLAGLLLGGVGVYALTRHPAQAAAPTHSAAVIAVATQPAAPRPAATAPASTTVAAPQPSPLAPTSSSAPSSPLDTRLAETEHVFAAQPDTTYTILLSFVPDTGRGMAHLLNQASRKLPLDSLYVYRANARSGQSSLGLTYGLFNNKASAVGALSLLPADLQQSHPVLRTIGGIRAELPKTDKNQ